MCYPEVSLGPPFKQIKLSGPWCDPTVGPSFYPTPLLPIGPVDKDINSLSLSMFSFIPQCSLLISLPSPSPSASLSSPLCLTVLPSQHPCPPFSASLSYPLGLTVLPSQHPCPPFSALLSCSLSLPVLPSLPPCPALSTSLSFPLYLPVLPSPSVFKLANVIGL